MALICDIDASTLASLAFLVADGKETNTMEAKMPMMAITTNNSIKVNPAKNFFVFLIVTVGLPRNALNEVSLL